MESLIRARGFSDAVVMFDDPKVTAIVATADQRGENPATLTELLSRSAGTGQENVAVIFR
jgi:hypothetical protein